MLIRRSLSAKPPRGGNARLSSLGIGAMPPGPVGHSPLVRPSYRILGRTHASVSGLFEAVSILDEARRSADNTPTLAHAAGCADPVERESESIFEPGRVGTRCMTCGAGQAGHRRRTQRPGRRDRSRPAPARRGRVAGPTTR